MPSAAEVAVNSVIPERAPPINTHHRLPAQGPTRPAGFAIPAGDNMSAGLFASTGTVMSPLHFCLHVGSCTYFRITANPVCLNHAILQIGVQLVKKLKLIGESYSPTSSVFYDN